MDLAKYYGNERVYSMKDLAIRLCMTKSEIKNAVRFFQLQPTVIDNRIWYFEEKLLVGFIGYLIAKEKLEEFKVMLNKDFQYL